MEKEEIVGRFLTMMMPAFFEEQERFKMTLASQPSGSGAARMPVRDQRQERGQGYKHRFEEPRSREDRREFRGRGQRHEHEALEQGQEQGQRHGRGHGNGRRTSPWRKKQFGRQLRKG